MATGSGARGLLLGRRGATELDPAWVRGRENIGVTAGSSTSGWLMDQLAAAIASGIVDLQGIVRLPPWHHRSR
jgi:4-hydroxy-3-methylbut-2-enyl diphosphate reductase IspH